MDPSIVDKPDIASYQPYVQGRCDPPVLIPLQMNQVSLEADCYLDTALVTMNATWRVHCVMGNGSCDCEMLIFEQKSSDLTASSDAEEVKRGFISALMLPSGQGLLGVTADQQFLIYDMEEDAEDGLNIILRKRLIGYNEEVVDMKFLGEEEKILVVATSVEHVRVYDLASMSCSYVLAGHTDVVLCLDTCVTSSRRPLIVTGSKDNSVRYMFIRSLSIFS